MLAAAGVTAVYMLSVVVVDQFRIQVGTRPIEELQKGARVGLSVLWSILGAAGFAAGLGAHRPPIRLFGLGLLGLATVKVFLVDLAQLETSYRVLSLMALGALLLISAAVYSTNPTPAVRLAPSGAGVIRRRERADARARSGSPAQGLGTFRTAAAQATNWAWLMPCPIMA